MTKKKFYDIVLTKDGLNVHTIEVSPSKTRGAMAVSGEDDYSIREVMDTFEDELKVKILHSERVNSKRTTITFHFVDTIQSNSRMSLSQFIITDELLDYDSKMRIIKWAIGNQIHPSDMLTAVVMLNLSTTTMMVQANDTSALPAISSDVTLTNSSEDFLTPWQIREFGLTTDVAKYSMKNRLSVLKPDTLAREISTKEAKYVPLVETSITDYLHADSDVSLINQLIVTYTIMVSRQKAHFIISCPKPKSAMDHMLHNMRRLLHISS